MHRAWLLLAAICLLAAPGCTTPVPPTPPGPAGNSAALRFANFTTPASAPDGFGSEPSLLVAQDGSLYFTTVLGSATARGDGLFRSADNGTTWTYLGKADYPFGGGDSDIDQLADGTLLVTGQWRPAAVPANPVGSPYVTGGESVARSTDGGLTWSTLPIAGYYPVADRNWLATTGNTVYLAFNQANAGLVVGKSTDGGATWMPPVDVAGSSDGPGAGPNGIAGDIVTDADGTLYIPYSPGPGGGTVQRVFRSTDGGQTFTTHVAHTTPAGKTSGAIFSTLAVDAGGELYLAWAETGETRAMRIYVSHSEDKGESWSDPVAASPPGVSAAFPWVVAGAPDHVAVAYYAAQGDTFSPDDAPANTTWLPTVSMTADIHAGNFTTVAVTQTPNHKGPICTGGTGCSSGRNLGDFFEAALDKWGHVVVVYADDTGEAQANHVAVQAAGPSLV